MSSFSQFSQFNNHHGIMTIDDMNLLEPNQAKDLVKQFSSRYPAQGLNILTQNNLTELIWYVKDKTQCSLPTDPLAITVNDLKDGYLAHEVFIAN